MQYLGYELHEEIVNALKDLGFKDFTQIQKQVMPKIFNKKSLIGQSKTGSGKTHSFLIPIFNCINLDKEEEVQAIVCAPTRELATQIYKMALHLASFFEKNIDIRLYSGGTDRIKEMARLDNSQPMIVIGTPGKINDLAIKENKLKIYTAKTLVIDEADMAFEIGFMEDLDKIASVLNNPQMLIFSATISEQIKPFIKKYIQSDEHVNVLDDTNSVEHILIPLKGRDRYKLLITILNNINPYLALIFANTKNEANKLAEYLNTNKYKVAVLHGGLEVRERKRIMKAIHSLKYQYVVASDIASRGIDIEGVTHVINFEIPYDYEFYVHRTGRTGRAGLTGIAISIGDFNDQEYLSSLTKKGIEFNYKDVNEKGFVDIKYSRTKRVKPISEERKKATKMVAKKTKVTPGYKKKRKEEIERITKKIRRNKK